MIYSIDGNENTYSDFLDYPDYMFLFQRKLLTFVKENEIKMISDRGYVPNCIIWKSQVLEIIREVKRELANKKSMKHVKEIM